MEEGDIDEYLEEARRRYAALPKNIKTIPKLLKNKKDRRQWAMQANKRIIENGVRRTFQLVLNGTQTDVGEVVEALTILLRAPTDIFGKERRNPTDDNGQPMDTTQEGPPPLTNDRKAAQANALVLEEGLIGKAAQRLTSYGLHNLADVDIRAAIKSKTPRATPQQRNDLNTHRPTHIPDVKVTPEAMKKGLKRLARSNAQDPWKYTLKMIHPSTHRRTRTRNTS